MRRIHGGRAVGALSLTLAVLLAAGAWAAVTVDRPPPTTTIAADGQAGATGLGSASLLDEQEAPAFSTTVTITAPATTPTSTPATTTTRPPTRPATTTTLGGTRTTTTLPPGVPSPPILPPTGIPNIPPATSWQVENQGVRAHMWIEPAAPVAGQAVRFLIDYASAEPCCMVMLDFGDGSAGYGLNTSRTCGEPSPLSPGAHSTATTHTYPAAGAYKATLSVMAKDLCPQGPIPPGSSPPTPDFDAVSATACIAIGPGTAGQKGCSPFPPFAPDQLVSPVIDPFCQVRSDCTQASTPRPGWDA